RRAVAERYWELLGGVPGVKACVPPEGVRHNYAYMPVVFDPTVFGATRDDVFDALAKEEIGARKYFHPLVSAYACYRGRFDAADTPVAREAAARVLTLPLYADLALPDVDRICGIVRGCVR
ncbi:DegT/DnrJ/EryC1/StrS family aminotransferase, partial [Adlercreutzia sp. ZJ242]|uniref:DegT/DnrJ/EryC1/StrS family aminotransferase n=1 Tax=Adlercreutzia sp. ZJ242 TaxID=2709409 RepID=UPI00197FC591